MAMYKNREVQITGVLEEMHPAKVYIEYIDGMGGMREAVNKNLVVVFDKKEVPEIKIREDKANDKDRKANWQEEEGYAVPTEDQKKVHENNMNLRKAQHDKKETKVEFKPAKAEDLKVDSKTSTPVVKTTTTTVNPASKQSDSYQAKKL